MTQYDEPSQGQQFFQDPYGADSRQGTVEESVHRRVVKRMDHQRTPGLPDLNPPRPWAAIIIASCSLALAAGALAFAFVIHSSASSQASQISQLQSQVSQMNTELGRTADTKVVNSLSGKVNAIATVVNGISAYNNVCSQDLTGSNGQPAVFLFPCAQKS